jgi:hypothetical protein
MWRAKVSASAHMTGLPGSRLILSIASMASDSGVSIAFDLGGLRRGRVVVRKAGFHLADHRNEVSNQADDHSEDA